MSGRIASLGLATALAFIACGGAAFAEDGRKITVTGEGRQSAAPDIALVTAGVVTQGPTAAEALSRNSTGTAAVIERLRGEGVAAADVQTSSFSLQPVYVYPKGDEGSSNPPRITGYSVTNSVTARVRDLGHLGAILDGVVLSGANSVTGIEFVVDHASALLDRARADAVADARHRAEIYAGAAGVKLGPLLSLSEQTVGEPPPRPMYRLDAATAASPVPVAVGESELRVQISATFRLGE